MANKNNTERIIALEKKHMMQTYTRPAVIIDHGNGCYVFDKSGKKYIDLVGGIATCTLGHGNKEFAEAVKGQIAKITSPSNLYHSEQQALLAEKLSNISGLDRCFFSNSGTESVEAAIKLARKHTGKSEIIAMKHGFHGRTFGSLAATWKEKIKAPFGPMLPGFVHVDYNDIKAVEKAISKQTAAVIVEPIQGESGVIVPSGRYLNQLRETCDKHGILLVLDEIQTACGRTGKFFAYQHACIKPNIVAVAKGLANGLPIGVTIATEKVAKSFGKGDHGSTFGGNPVSCSAANFTIDEIISKKLMKNAALMGDYLIKKLKEIDSASIKEVRGKGLMVGMELNGNGEKIVNKCLEKGLLVNLASEKVLRFLPPLTITKGIIDDSIIILKEVIENED